MFPSMKSKSSFQGIKHTGTALEEVQSDYLPVQGPVVYSCNGRNNHAWCETDLRHHISLATLYTNPSSHHHVSLVLVKQNCIQFNFLSLRLSKKNINCCVCHKCCTILTLQFCFLQIVPL